MSKPFSLTYTAVTPAMPTQTARKGVPRTRSAPLDDNKADKNHKRICQESKSFDPEFKFGKRILTEEDHRACVYCDETNLMIKLPLSMYCKCAGRVMCGDCFARSKCYGVGRMCSLCGSSLASPQILADQRIVRHMMVLLRKRPLQLDAYHLVDAFNEFCRLGERYEEQPLKLSTTPAQYIQFRCAESPETDPNNRLWSRDARTLQWIELDANTPLVLQKIGPYTQIGMLNKPPPENTGLLRSQ